ncbi:MAG: radical SAM protein [Ignisphaera sp.]|uniref:Radical SAM protein n=1 Tax=Ignisphaera aggregans TaxID=334771 RepID=A0A7J3N0F5_9CREN
MSTNTPVLGSGKLRTHSLLRGKVKVEFSRVDDKLEHLNNVKNTVENRDVAIYVHIPYCRSVCMFCPYFRDVLRSEQELEKYFKALLRELEIYGKLLEEKNLNVVEVHVGGGTPSLVSSKLYKEFVDALTRFFSVKCKIGIEVNPEDFKDYRYVEELYSVGVDEVSIGVQSFDRRILKSLSRKHTPEDNVKAIENSIKAGFKWINVDIMFLTPSIKGCVELTLDEKLKAFREDLEKSYKLGVHQVTFYPTVIPKHTPGYKLAGYGRLSQELNYIDAFIDEAVKFTQNNSLHLIRVYSASRKRYEYTTVNLELVGPLIGLGASAWSNTGTYQYINTHSIQEYVGSIEKSTPPVIYSRSLKHTSRLWRLFFDQLSAVEISEESFKLIGLKKMPFKVKLLLKVLELSGIVTKSGRTYRLTRLGIREVYKSVMNYVIEVPVKTTGIFIEMSKFNNYPETIKIE